MSCICDPYNLDRAGHLVLHTDACINYNVALEKKWENQKEPCSGSGYAHKAHGACPGYSTDRT